MARRLPSLTIPQQPVSVAPEASFALGQQQPDGEADNVDKDNEEVVYEYGGDDNMGVSEETPAAAADLPRVFQILVRTVRFPARTLCGNVRRNVDCPDTTKCPHRHQYHHGC